LQCFWYWIRMCLNAGRASDFILLMIIETPRRALPYS
jgi:hypothetical protein